MNLNPPIRAMEPYVPGTTIPGAVKLSSNENPLGPSPRALDAIRGALDGIHRYPDGSASRLREALAARWDVDTESVLVANGSDEAFMLLTAAWLGRGENGITARETFSQYAYAVELFGGEIRRAPLLRGVYDLDTLLALADEKTRFFFVCNPNNPTGTYTTHNEMVGFLERVPPEVLVVLDEAYADFADAADFPDSRRLLELHPNLVVTRTFSKIYGLAGMRIGFAVGSPEVIDGARRAMMPFSVNILGQIAALAALEDHDFVQSSRRMVKEGKALMMEELGKRGIAVYPTQSNFLCLDMGRPTATVWTEIARRGIAIRDLKSFGLPEYARFTVGRREENQKFLSILDEVLR